MAGGRPGSDAGVPSTSLGTGTSSSSAGPSRSSASESRGWRWAPLLEFCTGDRMLSGCYGTPRKQQAPGDLTVRFLSGEAATVPVKGLNVGDLRLRLADDRGVRHWQVQLLKPSGEAVRDEEDLATYSDLLCVLSAGYLKEIFDVDWSSRWSLGPCLESAKALCTAKFMVDNGTPCLSLMGPRGTTLTVLHRNGVWFDLGPDVRPRVIRWRQKICRQAYSGVACGYFLVTSSNGEHVVHCHSERGSGLDFKPAGRWVSVEVELKWGDGLDCGVDAAYYRDGSKRPEEVSTKAKDARYIYLFNRSDSSHDTRFNEVRYADIIVE